MSQDTPMDGVHWDRERPPWPRRHVGALIWAGIALAAAFIALLVVTASGDVKVGACMLPNVKPKVTLVDCSDPVAGYRVVGKLDDPDEARRKVLGLGSGSGLYEPSVCSAFSDADTALVESHSNGSASVFCLPTIKH
jgi:hypothetical protein